MFPVTMSRFKKCREMNSSITTLILISSAFKFILLILFKLVMEYFSLLYCYFTSVNDLNTFAVMSNSALVMPTSFTHLHPFRLLE